MPLNDSFYWKHHWLTNPNYPVQDGKWPMGWILETQSGEIKGYLGNIPLLYEWHGQQLVAASTTTWLVDPSVSSQAIQLISKFFSQPQVDLFLNTTPNLEASKAMRLFRANPMPGIDCRKRCFWIVNYPGFLKGVFKRKRLLFTGQLASMISPVLEMVDYYRHRSLRQFSADPTVQTTHSFDDRFDVFWKLLRKQSDKLLLVRSKKQLNWYFEEALGDSKGWINIYEKNNKLIGYAVFIRRDIKEYGISRVLLADLQILNSVPKETMLYLLAAGILECKNRSIHMLDILYLSAEKLSILEELAPRYRLQTSDTFPFFYKFKDKLLSTKFENSDYWDPCILDGDAVY